MGHLRSALGSSLAGLEALASCSEALVESGSSRGRQPGQAPGREVDDLGRQGARPAGLEAGDESQEEAEAEPQDKEERAHWAPPARARWRSRQPALMRSSTQGFSSRAWMVASASSCSVATLQALAPRGRV